MTFAEHMVNIDQMDHQNYTKSKYPKKYHIDDNKRRTRPQICCCLRGPCNFASDLKALLLNVFREGL